MVVSGKPLAGLSIYFCGRIAPVVHHRRPSKIAKRNPSQRQGQGLRDFELLGVRNASVGESGVVVVNDFLPASVVVLAAVGEFHAGLGSRCRSCVGVTSIEKCSHGCSSKKSKSPFRGLECLRPTGAG